MPSVVPGNSQHGVAELVEPLLEVGQADLNVFGRIAQVLNRKAHALSRCGPHLHQANLTTRAVLGAWV